MSSPPPYSPAHDSGWTPSGYRPARSGGSGHPSRHTDYGSISNHDGGHVLDTRNATIATRTYVIAMLAMLCSSLLFVSVLVPMHWSADAHLVRQHREEIGQLRKAYEDRLQQKDDWVAVEKTKLAAREGAVRREEERISLDIERRKRSNIYWGPLEWDAACVSWKTMHYSSELLNLPTDVDGVAWCQGTSIDIFGITHEKPEYCTKTMMGKVIGHWTRTDEPHCNTYWGNLQDWGCQPGLPGHRRIRMQLLDHHQPWEETWFALCQTTPWPGHGTPGNCEQTAHGGGIWGEWRLPDDSCN